MRMRESERVNIKGTCGESSRGCVCVCGGSEATAEQLKAPALNSESYIVVYNMHTRDCKAASLK